jgi:hypothetical protein
MTSVAQAIKAMGFKRTTAGARYGIRPRLMLDNVEVSHDRSHIDVWVHHPDGLYEGPHRRVTLDLDRWPTEAAIAVLAAIVEHRKEGLKR